MTPGSAVRLATDSDIGLGIDPDVIADSLEYNFSLGSSLFASGTERQCHLQMHQTHI